MPSAPTGKQLRALLRKDFGHCSFRPGQERAIRDLLDGRDVLALLPTGAGKSLVYQLAAQLLPGMTIVVSPLIALMHDQEQSLEELGVGVAVLNSSLSEREAAEELENVRDGEAKLLYVTPERFENGEFMERIRRLTVSLLVVDEAHCISEWGHDFRPAYLALGQVVEQLRRPTLLALTATATPWVRRDIAERLGMRDPDVIVRGTDRPSLVFEARRVDSEGEEWNMLERLLTGDGDAEEYADAALVEQLRETMQGCGIVYAATTKAAQETAEWLQANGIPADYYHGQRKKAERERAQQAFMDGEVRVIAATNAFGLGVDKPDVRFVIHRDVPASVEAYYQEAGRAGRDGELARCTLIYRPADLGRAAFLAGGGELTLEEVRQARRGLLKLRHGTRRELEQATGLSKADLGRLLDLLLDAGHLELRRGRIRLLVDDFDPSAISLESEAQRRAYERSRLDMMRGYAELRDCRRRYLLNYFGEELEAERCGRCDNDLRATVVAAVDNGHAAAALFTVNERVAHQAWGEGVVQRATADDLTVLFESVGYKSFDPDLVRERGILRSLGAEVSAGS